MRQILNTNQRRAIIRRHYQDYKLNRFKHISTLTKRYLLTASIGLLLGGLYGITNAKTEKVENITKQVKPITLRATVIKNSLPVVKRVKRFKIDLTEYRKKIAEDKKKLAEPKKKPVVKIYAKPQSTISSKSSKCAEPSWEYKNQVIKDAAKKYGVNYEFLYHMALYESSIRQCATSLRNSNGSRDRGIMQWNDKAHPDISNSCAYNVKCAIEKAAFFIQQGKECRWATAKKLYAKGLSSGILKPNHCVGYTYKP